MIISRRKEILKRVLCFFFASLLMILAPASTYALNPSLFKEYSQADIYFYDPSAGPITCYSGNLSGDTIMAKVVSYLKGNNPTRFVLSDNGIAGILANFQAESGFNPFRFQGDDINGPAYGIAQFDPKSKITDQLNADSRTASFFNEYFDLKYTFFNEDTGLPIESVPMAVVDAWLSVQLDYFFGPDYGFNTERVGTYRNHALEGNPYMGLEEYISDDMTPYEAMNAAMTPEDATRIFVWIMERPSAKETDSNNRSLEAKKWLEYVQTISSNGGSNDRTSTSSDGDKVTIIGDLITVGSENEIKKVLPKADIHARDGMSFSDGISVINELIKSNKLGDVIIYELGMDGNVTEEMVNEVINLVGKSRKIVFSNTSEYLGLNNILKNAANNNDNVEVLDWKGAVEGKETQYLSGSGVNEEGATLFATIVKNTVDDLKNAIPTCVSGAVEGGLTEEQAQAIADYYNSPAVDGHAEGLDWSAAGHNGKDNCVAFSVWFAKFFAGFSYQAPDGRDVAHQYAVSYGLEEGNEPRPFAIFSTTDSNAMCGGVPCGHTGIVVSVDGNKVTTIAAAYQYTPARLEYYSKDDFVNTVYGTTFTYLDSYIDQSKLAEIIGN